MRLLTGVAIASIFVIAESCLNDRSDNENRGRVMALYMILCMGGMAGGQFLLTVADLAGSVTGPLAVSMLSPYAGNSAFPMVLVAVHLMTALFGIRLLSRRPSLGADQAIHHMVSQRASPVMVSVTAMLDDDLVASAHPDASAETDDPVTYKR